MNRCGRDKALVRAPDDLLRSRSFREDDAPKAMDPSYWCATLMALKQRSTRNAGLGWEQRGFIVGGIKMHPESRFTNWAVSHRGRY